MKVLWITYVLFPEAQSLITGEKTSKKGSGGWLLGSANALVDTGKVDLHVAIVNRAVKKYAEVLGEKIKYYLIPYGKGVESDHHDFDKYWLGIKQNLSPDVVHIHGIESTLALSYCRVCGNDNVVVSIQGIKSVIGRYFFSGFTSADYFKSISLRDIIRGQSLYYHRRKFIGFKKYEHKMLRDVKYVIGRTSWDKTHVLSMNPDIHYFHCDETLRDVFYSDKWEYEKCVPHTIFLSAANATFKGAHQLFRALTLIKKRYPDTKVLIAGSSQLATHSFVSMLKRDGYECILYSILKKNGLLSDIKFLGSLDDEAMKKAYLSSNVFVCPSTIENSSNSVSEAQLLGVPIVASYVGGVPDLLQSVSPESLFRFEEYEMLAKKVCDIFENSNMCDYSKSRICAAERHNREKNAQDTLGIYQKIIGWNRANQTGR